MGERWRCGGGAKEEGWILLEDGAFTEKVWLVLGLMNEKKKKKR